MDTNDKILICKVVAQAMIADAQLTDEEMKFLEKLMTTYGLDASQRHDVLARNVGDDPREMVAGLSGDDAKNQLFVELALAVAADGEISSSERELMGKVAEALDVTPEDLELMLKAAIS